MLRKIKLIWYKLDKRIHNDPTARLTDVSGPYHPAKWSERLPKAIMARPAPGCSGVLSLADFLNLC